MLLYALNQVYPESFYFQKDTDRGFQLSKSNFNVGSIRRLGDWYFSSWSYNPEGACHFRYSSPSEGYSECQHAAQHHLFLKWIGIVAPTGLGYASWSFHNRYRRNRTCTSSDLPCVHSEIKSYLLSSQESVWIDHWVRSESQHSDFIRSIATYSKGRKAGPLNMTLVAMVIAEQTEKEKAGQYPDVTAKNMADKDPSRTKEDFVKDSYFSQLSPAMALLAKTDPVLKEVTMC